MSAPIPVYKGANIFGTRRTERGACYLTPNAEVRNILVYLALHYAQQYNLRLLVLCILSNHLHWDADDPDGNYPAFLVAFHSKAAEVLNEYYGRTGPMWANGKPGRTRVHPENVMDKLLYIATNPTWHGLVPCSRLWPGFVFSPEDAGRTITAACPAFLQEKYNGYPDKVEYVVPVPSVYGTKPAAKVRADFRRRRRLREARLRKTRTEFPDLEELLAAGPDLEVPEKDDPRNLTNKLFDCPPQHRATELAALCDFRRRYYTARREFRRGKRNVKWPRGTYAMVAWHKCPGEDLT